MTERKVLDSAVVSRIMDSLDVQEAIRLIGAEITEIASGFCEMRMPMTEKITQQNGYVHAGILAILADSAGGYAAYTMIPEDSNILAVEFKMNFIAPAKGDEIIARGNVIKSGRTITVCRVDIYAIDDDEETHCSLMQQTLIRIDPRK